MRRTIVTAISLAALFAAAPAEAAKLSRLIAAPAACPHQRNAGAPVAVQEQAMRCMTNFARRRAQMPTLIDAPDLDRSAAMKSRDIVRCDSFSHLACGRDFTYWMQRVGYLAGGCWRVGENIAWGSGRYATVRSIFTAWIHSPGHRENILSPAYRQLGVGLDIGVLEGYDQAHVWVQHFGSHC